MHKPLLAFLLMCRHAQVSVPHLCPIFSSRYVVLSKVWVVFVNSHMAVCVYHISEGVFTNMHSVRLENTPYLAGWVCKEPESLTVNHVYTVVTTQLHNTITYTHTYIHTIVHYFFLDVFFFLQFIYYILFYYYCF